jgi:DNA-binding SARP family transcriptional activator
VIRCRTLGPVEVTVDGATPPAELLWRKNIALLVYLARSPRRTRTREHLVGLLWGDRPETAARHSLREAVHALRRAAGDRCVETVGEQVRLADGLVELDVERFETLAGAGDWAAAAELALGEFLEGLSVPGAPEFEDWLMLERQKLRQRSVAVLVHEAEALLRRGDQTASAEHARRALMLDPLAELAVRGLMRALAVGGERAAALAAFESYALRARESQGTEPDAETLKLAEQVRLERGWKAASREDEEGKARGAESRRTPLVGRERELTELLDLWQRCCASARAAIAFLEGDTGVGRTRLADEVAARARLGGASASAVRAVPGDAAEAWSVVLGLARGGLIEARGLAAANPEALAAFATRISEWGDRFAAARRAAPLPLGHALAEIVRAAADEQPVLLVVDDAQWIDTESLNALDATVRDNAAAPLLVVLTRSRHPAHEALDRVRAAVGRDTPGTVLELLPLAPQALRDLAHWALPAYTPAELDRITRRIAVDSAGLPLLAVELLHAVALGLNLHETPQAWPEQHQTLEQTLPGDLPEAVVSAIRVGFRRLSKDAQLVLAAASVLGDTVDATTLTRATGIARERVVAALDEAEWQRWLAADGRGYSYVARIVRDVVGYDMVTAGQRRRFLQAAQLPA